MWCQVSAHCCSWQEGLPCRGNAVWWYVGEEQGIEEMPERSRLGKSVSLGGISGEAFESTSKGKQRWGRATVGDFPSERLLVL